METWKRVVWRTPQPNEIVAAENDGFRIPATSIWVCLQEWSVRFALWFKPRWQLWKSQWKIAVENRSGKPQWKTAVEKHPARCFTNVTFAFFCPKAAVKLRFKILSSKLRLNDWLEVRWNDGISLVICDFSFLLVSQNWKYLGLCLVKKSWLIDWMATSTCILKWSCPNESSRSIWCSDGRSKVPKLFFIGNEFDLRSCRRKTVLLRIQNFRLPIRACRIAPLRCSPVSDQMNFAAVIICCNISLVPPRFHFRDRIQHWNSFNTRRRLPGFSSERSLSAWSLQV